MPFNLPALPTRSLIAVVIVLCLQRSAAAQIVQVFEAEACDVRRVDGAKATVYESLMASGTKRVGDFWGERKGDEVRWTFDAKRRETRLRLAVRYSYNHGHYTQMRGPRPAERALTLLVDGAETGSVKLVDTGNWEDFSSAYVDLPDLAPGKHAFALRAPADGLTTDLDAFTLFRGDPDRVLTPGFRNTVVIRSPNGRFTVRLTARCVTKDSPEQIVRNFERIYGFFKDYMGWEPDRPVINIHVLEHALRRGTFENLHGIYFEEGNFDHDRGNWIHEMNHVFDNGMFPGWTGHPMIRMNDTFVTGPGCFPELWKGPPSDPQWKIRLNAGRRVIHEVDYRTDSAEEVLYAMRAKYGKDILRRFYKECRDADARGEIELTRGQGPNRDQYVQLMSRAAGEDVLPYFRKWNGFDAAR